MTRCPATNPDAVPVDRRNDYLLARWSLVGGMADRSGDPLGYLQRNAMFSPAKRAIDPHSPNTPLASPGEPLPTYPIWHQPNDPVAGSKTRDGIRYRMTARRARANARGRLLRGFDSANRTWVLRTTGVNVNGGWMTSPFGS